MARRLLNPSATALAVGITVFGLVAIVALVVATWSLKISVDQAADRAADRSLCTFYEFQLSGSPPTTQRGHDLLELARREYEHLGCR